MIASPLRYSALCALVLGGLAALAAQGTRLELLPALLLVPLAAWPAWLALAYSAAVHKAQARAVLREGERPWWGPFLGGALLRQVLAAPLALLAAASVGWWLLSPGGLRWMAATALLLYPVALVVHGQARALRPFARLRPVLLMAPPVAAAALTLAWALLAEAAGPGTLAQYVAAEPRYEGSSALLAWGVDGMAVLNGARAWGLAWAEGRVGPVATLWRLGATFGQFWLLASVFAGLLLPAGEGRRILRASAADRPPPPGASRAALAGFLLAALSGALVALAAEGEARAAGRSVPRALIEVPLLSSPDAAAEAPRLAAAPDGAVERPVSRLPTPMALRAVVEAERIGAMACLPGTIAGIEAADRAIHDLLAARRAELERTARTGFEAMRARVPLFLDGYYSLTAEYLRTFHLLAGDAEAFLRGALQDALAPDEAFARFQAALLGAQAPLPAEMRSARDRLLAECALLPRDDVALRVTASAPDRLLAASPEAKLLAFEGRLAASGLGALGGGVAGAVGGKVMAKLVASETFGLAGEAVARLAMAKAAGGLGGAAAGAGAGALAGSVMPGLGTTLGAAVGGVVGGLALGVATDLALIRLEEAVSREAFETEILAAIGAAEAELLGTLLPAP